MTTTSYHHIELDADRVPWIAGTNIKVVEVVTERLAYEWSAEQIQAQHPNLTLAQVHSALAFYYDHQQEMDKDIERRLARADQLFPAGNPSAVRLKLRSMGHWA